MEERGALVLQSAVGCELEQRHKEMKKDPTCYRREKVVKERRNNHTVQVLAATQCPIMLRSQ